MKKKQKHYIYKSAYRSFINNLKLRHTPLREKRGSPLCYILNIHCLLPNNTAKLEELKMKNYLGQAIGQEI